MSSRILGGVEAARSLSRFTVCGFQKLPSLALASLSHVRHLDLQRDEFTRRPARAGGFQTVVSRANWRAHQLHSVRANAAGAQIDCVARLRAGAECDREWSRGDEEVGGQLKGRPHPTAKARGEPSAASGNNFHQGGWAANALVAGRRICCSCRGDGNSDHSRLQRCLSAITRISRGKNSDRGFSGSLTNRKR